MGRKLIEEVHGVFDDVRDAEQNFARDEYTSIEARVICEIYSAGLPRTSVLVLQRLPYDAPSPVPPVDLKICVALAKQGLLEQHPDTPDVFRCTQLGGEVVRSYQQRGWL